MWVFGYGSLIWNPGFEYLDSKIGFIKGYVRRFWQGNDFHRGSPNKPGRVATLVEDTQGLTWGRAFLLDSSAESSLAYLDSRETKLGGYVTKIATFHPRDPKEEPVPVLLYIALPSSRLYIGPAPLPQVATEIAEAVGTCGHNAEYVLRLSDFMKEHVPDMWDEHLYLLDHLVRARLKERQVSVDDIMGEEKPIAIGPIRKHTEDEQVEEQQGFLAESPNAYTSRIPTRKLKCLDL